MSNARYTTEIQGLSPMRGAFASILLTVLTCIAIHPSLCESSETATAPKGLSRASIPGPDAPMAAEELGDLHMARKRYQAAIQAYLQASPRSAIVWNKMGMANQQMYILAEAKKDYEMALKLSPKNADIMNNLGTVYFGLKQYANAERLYRRALKLEPKSALIYKNLGTDLLLEDKYKKGWQSYQLALSIDPEIFERVNQFRVGEPTPVNKRGAMNYFLAKSYAHAGQIELAVGYLRMAIDEGFTDRKKVMADLEFANLRGQSAFQQLISEQRAQ